MRILIADDHTLFRESLRSLIERHGLEVVAEAGSGRQAVELAMEEKPDVVLMDLTMPEMGGIEATRILREELPETKVVVLTASDDDNDLFEALKAGAQGFLPKEVRSKDFFLLLEGAVKGEPALTPQLARKVLLEFAEPMRSIRKRDHPDSLTDRELEVLQSMVDGTTSNRSLARKMKVSENTIKFHVRNILDKLHLHSRAQAVGFAIRHKLVEPTPPTE